MGEELAITASVAWLIPLVVSFLKQRAFPPIVNMALAGAAAFGVATLAIVITGQIDFDDGVQEMNTWIAAAGLAFAESQVIYRLIIKGTAMGERINEAISTFPLRPTEATPIGEGEAPAPDPSTYRAFTVEEEQPAPETEEPGL